MGRWALLCVLGVAVGTRSSGAEIEGRVVIEHKLTPRKVTAPASAYSRGTAVSLRRDAPVDPLDYERNHVVVYLEDASLPNRPVTSILEQRGRQFVEDLLVVPVGSTVSFPNRDEIFHNVFSLSRTKSFDLGNYPKDDTRNVRFPVAGLVLVGCHLHPNMGAAIMVTPNRWGTRVEPSGSFRLPDVPDGHYTLVAWHKQVGYFRQVVELHGAESVHVQFFLPIREREIR